MFKFLYTLLTNPLGLPINPIWEYLILLIVGEVVHEIAWQVSPGGELGSFIYWVTKLLAFVVIWAVLYGIIWFAQFVSTYIWWIIGVLGVISIALTIVRICINRKFNSANEDK